MGCGMACGNFMLPGCYKVAICSSNIEFKNKTIIIVAACLNTVTDISIYNMLQLKRQCHKHSAAV